MLWFTSTAHSAELEKKRFQRDLSISKIKNVSVVVTAAIKELNMICIFKINHFFKISSVDCRLCLYLHDKMRNIFLPLQEASVNLI